MDSNDLHSSELLTWMELKHSEDIKYFCNTLEEKLYQTFYADVFAVEYEFVTRTPEQNHEILLTVKWPVQKEYVTRPALGNPGHMDEKIAMYVMQSPDKQYQIFEPAKIFCEMVDSKKSHFTASKCQIIATKLKHQFTSEYLYGQ